jgi:hypothetical protein
MCLHQYDTSQLIILELILDSLNIFRSPIRLTIILALGMPADNLMSNTLSELNPSSCFGRSDHGEPTPAAILAFRVLL